MSRVRAVTVLALSLAALLAMAGVSGAEGADAEEDIALDTSAATEQAESLDDLDGAVDEAAGSTDEEATTLDAIGAALGQAAQAVAEAAAAVAGAVGHAAVAVGQGLLTAIHAVGDGVVWTATAIGSALAWTGKSLWSATTATGAAIAWLASAIGTGTLAGVKAVGSGLAWTGKALWTGLVATGDLVAAAAIGTWGLLADLTSLMVEAWPESPRDQAIAASAAGASAAAAGAAAWYTRVWRYLGAVPFLAPLYARIRREDLLEHPMRAEIHRLIQGTPGIHMSELGRELDTSWGTLLHHLDKLEKGRLIVSEEVQGKRCFFLPGQVSQEQKDILPALENETARSIAEFFAENPGATQSEAAAALDLSAALVSWHVKRLEKAGVLERTREGRTKKVGLTQAAMTAMASV